MSHQKPQFLLRVSHPNDTLGASGAQSLIPSATSLSPAGGKQGEITVCNTLPAPRWCSWKGNKWVFQCFPFQGWDWVSSTHAAIHFNPLKSEAPFLLFERKRRNILFPLISSSFEYLWYNFISSLVWQIKLFSAYENAVICSPCCCRFVIVFPFPWAVMSSANIVDVEEQENTVWIYFDNYIIGNPMDAGKSRSWQTSLYKLSWEAERRGMH